MMTSQEWCPQHGYPEPCAKCGRDETEKAYKRGFKEGKEEESTQAYHAGLADGIDRGRREVLNFLHDNSAGIMMNEYALAVKLNEWGLEEK
jgi:flagellar biosynthesis/type III secretory pathway protein FliH